MLGGRNQRAGRVAQHGGEFGGGHRVHIGADFALVADHRHRTNEPMPVSASAGCKVSVTGRPECTPIPKTRSGRAASSACRLSSSRSTLAQPRPIGCDSPSPARSTADRILATFWMNMHRGRSTALSPDKNPLVSGTLTMRRSRPIHAFLPSVTFKRPQSSPPVDRGAAPICTGKACSRLNARDALPAIEQPRQCCRICRPRASRSRPGCGRWRVASVRLPAQEGGNVELVLLGANYAQAPGRPCKSSP